MKLPLAARPRAKLQELLALHQEGVRRLRPLWQQYLDTPGAAWTEEIPDLEEVADALRQVNRNLVEWHDAHLSDFRLWDDEEGFTGAPSLVVNTNRIEEDRLPRFREGEEFVIYDEESDIEDLLADDPEQTAYLANLAHLAATGYPMLSRENQAAVRKLAVDAKALSSLLESLLRYG